MRTRLRRTHITARGTALGFWLAILGGVGCSGKADKQTAADTLGTGAGDTVETLTLYTRLGGKPAVAAVVDTFVARVAADRRINKKFARSDIPRVKAMLNNQICAQTGGSCTYIGRPMKETHRNMRVTEGEFNALVEDLAATLKQLKVPEQEQKELLAALGSMKGDIVEVKSSATGTKLPATFKPAPGLPPRH